MAKLMLYNLGTNKRLAAVAETQTIRLDGIEAEVEYACRAIGKTRWTRHVMQTGPHEYWGRTSPLTAEPDTRRFDDVDEAISWLTAGKQPRRAEFADEVDFRAVVGEREGKFRLAQMAECGVFDPREFAECMLLRSHAAVDWGHCSPQTVNHRLDFWDENQSEMLAPWPDLPPDQRGLAHVAYVRIVDALVLQFQARAA